MDRRRFITLPALMMLSEQLMAKMPVHRTGLVLDEHYANYHIHPEHPESPARYHTIYQHLHKMDIVNFTQAISPKKGSEKWLRLIHSQQHIDTIKKEKIDAHQQAVLATAGVLALVDAVFNNEIRNAFCASRPPGHHAKNTGQEEGFCYYNHIAIAARYAQQQYGVKKVLIVDWDYHHGNGTEWAFYTDPNVLYFSTHDVFAYPGTGFPSRQGEGDGLGFNINVHLDCGARDNDIIRAFQQKLLPALDDFSPDLILISAGFDSRHDDLLGCFDITDQGFTILTNMLKTVAEQHCGGKLISILEGGYNLQGNASGVIAHIKALMV